MQEDSNLVYDEFDLWWICAECHHYQPQRYGIKHPQVCPQCGAYLLAKPLVVRRVYSRASWFSRWLWGDTRGKEVGVQDREGNWITSRQDAAKAAGLESSCSTTSA